MGCVSSRRIDKEERVQICRERKGLMKQLLVLRSQFAAAQMAYLQALKNTGATLRQFTDSESFDIEILLPCSSSSPFELDLTSSPPPLPPPPPPLPPFSPDHDDEEEVEDEDEIGSPCLPPPLPPTSLAWDSSDPLCLPSSSSSLHQDKGEEEDWVDTNMEFEKERQEIGQQKERVINDIVLHPLSKHSLGNDNAVIVPRSKKKTLSGVIKEIDDYFLKASGSGRDVILLLDIRGCDSLYPNSGDSMRKSGKSSKVFSALSWSWSSRSLHSSKDTIDCYEPGEPCKPGAHGITLERLYTEEEKLYKEVKEEENTKLEYGRKTLLLQKYEDGDQDLLKTEEIRSSIETLQYDMCGFQQLICETNSTILKLIDEELHPQLIILSSGLMHMWKTMHECHQVQGRIAQQMNHLMSHDPSIEPTTDYHHHSTVQLETEVNGWYISFCHLLNSQRDYVQVLNKWVQLTDCLVDGEQERRCLSIVQHLCEHWKVGMDHLPDKVAEEAIKSFLSVIHSVVLQQTEENMLQKKLGRLEKKLQREMNLLDEMEKKLDSNVTGDVLKSSSPNHPLAVKRAKIELFKRRVEEEKTKYLNSVKLSHSMTLNSLLTGLPVVFKALSVFSNVCAQAFEAVNSHREATVCQGSETEICDSS